MDEKTLVRVRNRNNGTTGYTIADKGIWRNFAPGETKMISIEELRQLQWQPGGDYTLANCLVVEDAEALKMLNMETEPEYSYTEKDIENLLFNGSIDQLKDFLDFAPEGAIEVAKTVAVQKEIPDIRKRDLISEATGFNINSAIMVNHITEDESEDSKKEEPKKRRAEPINSAATEVKARRTDPITAPKPATPNYKVVK